MTSVREAAVRLLIIFPICIWYRDEIYEQASNICKNVAKISRKKKAKLSFTSHIWNLQAPLVPAYLQLKVYLALWI